MKERYYVPPATAEQIRKAVGVTREDIKAVNEVLRELGHPTTQPKLRHKPGNGNGGRSSRSGQFGKATQKGKLPRAKRSTAAR